MRLRELIARLRDRWDRERLTAELDEELRFHRALLQRDGEDSRAFGNITYYKEETRVMWSLGVIDDLLQDLRYAFRVLRRDIGFTLAVVMTLALGIGANTAVFSVVNAVLLQPLPYPEPERLISIWTSPTSAPADRNPTSLPTLRDWQWQATMLEGIGGYAFNRFDLRDRGPDDQARAILATGGLYDILGAKPLIGRLPARDEESAPVVAISYRLWRERYAGDPSVIGQRVSMNRQPYTIIGVMPPGFHFPTPDIDLWSTLYSIVSLPNGNGSNPWLDSRSFRGYRVVARLGRGTTAAQAERALNEIQRRLGAQFPASDAAIDLHVQSVRDDALSAVQRGLWTVFGAALLILLLACVNVAHLLLARLSARERELAVRRALGAHRSRVLRQLMTESVVLGLLGGGVGVAVAFAGMRILARLMPADMPQVENIAMDFWTLGFALACSVVAGMIFGVVPALLGWGHDLQTTLRGQGRGSDGSRGSRTRLVLTAVEVAFAVIILIGAGLMLRSFRELTAAKLGFRSEGVVIEQLSLVGPRYASDEAKTQAVDAVLRNLRAVPNVSAVGGSTSMPPTRIQVIEGYGIVGEPPAKPGQETTAIFIPATSEFLEALHVPLIAGRTFDTRDNARSAPVAIISRELAHRHFATANPLGQQLQASGVTWTIIGVVDDVVYQGVGSPTKPEIYVPFSQSPFAGVWLAIRTTADPRSLAPAIRDAFRRVDPELAIRQPRPLESMIAESVVRPRFQAWLLSTFGGLALVLAAVGIYGVIAYGVTQRRGEIGIRIALGASRQSVVTHVLARGMTPVAVGLVVGLAISYLAARTIASLLYGISPTDAPTFAIVAGTLVLTGVLSASLPARRAASIDPVSAMRGP